MEAEIRLAMVPASMARTPSLAKSLRRSGTSAPMPPICMPMELRLANPHRAKVAMVKERGASVAFCAPRRDVGDDFIERHARAEQVADGAAVVPGNADEPGNGREEEAENLAERAGNPVHVAEPVRPAEQAVEQGDERQKADEHDGHVEGQLAAVDGAAGDGADEVFVLVQLVLGDDDAAFGGGDFRFRGPASWP